MCEFCIDMVETRAARRARESDSTVASKSVIVVSLVLNPTPLISRRTYNISAQQDVAHSEEYFARTYKRRSCREGGGIPGKVRFTQPSSQNFLSRMA